MKNIFHFIQQNYLQLIFMDFHAFGKIFKYEDAGDAKKMYKILKQ